MDSKKALIVILSACILVFCAFFISTCTGIGRPSGLYSLAIPADSGNPETNYALQFPLVCHSFIVAIILLLVLLFVSTKRVLETRTEH